MTEFAEQDVTVKLEDLGVLEMAILVSRGSAEQLGTKVEARHMHEAGYQ
jgi:hypothetical protein